MILPSLIWCHLDAQGTATRPNYSADVTVPVPSAALDWMRESVRGTAFLLDRGSFAVAWAWLGDHQGVARAVRELHRGHAFEFTLDIPAGRWTWTARPVRPLPLATITGDHVDHEPIG